MDGLDANIMEYEKDQINLEKNHMGKWVMFHNGKIAGAFDTFQAALQDGEERFANSPFLIRQVGAPTEQPLPMSVIMGK